MNFVDRLKSIGWLDRAAIEASIGSLIDSRGAVLVIKKERTERGYNYSISFTQSTPGKPGN